MIPTAYILAPLLLLLPALGVVEQARGPFAEPDTAKPQTAQQVSMEQRVTIRIGPRSAPMAMQPTMFAESLDGDGARFQERRIGKCLPINLIMGVQPVTNNKLLLIMNDQRLITAQLEKGCRAREFYSGFIVQRSADGQICVKRDPLLSRSGTRCEVAGFRQLTPMGE